MIETIFILLVAFQVKHFIADYPLQTPYMLGKMKSTGWVKPLAVHALIHAMFTIFIAIWFNPHLALALGVIDFILHFIIDRLKASPNLGGRFKPDQPYFWWALGADQMAHHLTHYIFIYMLITYGVN